MTVSSYTVTVCEDSAFALVTYALPHAVPPSMLDGRVFVFDTDPVPHYFSCHTSCSRRPALSS